MGSRGKIARGLRVGIVAAVLGIFIFAVPQQATAVEPYYYANWTTRSGVGGFPGTVTGVINVPGDTIGVVYTGEFSPETQLNNTGTNFWSPASTYTSPTVPNAPSTTDMIAAGNNGGAWPGVNTIVFSEPVYDPILSFISLGAGPRVVEFVFDKPFDLLSNGPGHFGGSIATFSQPSANVVRGNEGSGVIRFPGLVSSISFTKNTTFNENWHAFTVGVPEPTLGLPLVIAAAAASRSSRRREPAAK